LEVARQREGGEERRGEVGVEAELGRREVRRVRGRRGILYQELTYDSSQKPYLTKRGAKKGNLKGKKKVTLWREMGGGLGRGRAQGPLEV
jgi:hypothetical protein